MTTWFTSDLHIGHKHIIKYCQRPWLRPLPHMPELSTQDVDAMDDALVANWNSVVKPGDTVWNLGDLTFCCAPKYALKTLLRLNGRHIVIRGNHDEVLDTITESEGCVPWIEGGRQVQEVTVDGQTIVLCHYAMRSWHHDLHGTWHLFGHTHAGLAPYGKSVDVGVDNAFAVLSVPQFTPESYRPISFAELKVYMDKQPPGPHPPFAGVPVKHGGLNAS